MQRGKQRAEESQVLVSFALLHSCETSPGRSFLFLVVFFCFYLLTGERTDADLQDGSGRHGWIGGASSDSGSGGSSVPHQRFRLQPHRSAEEAGKDLNLLVPVSFSL